VESQATARYIRSTPRKARLVSDAIRGKMVAEALNLLNLSIRRGVAADVAKMLKSAVANLQSKNPEANVNVDELRIKEVRVEQGPTLKRMRARAQGRAARILKHMCHITVTVSD
jgi:large subunit ribosomal protein L22